MIVGFIFITGILVILSVAANGYSVHNIHKNTMPSANHSHSSLQNSRIHSHTQDKIMLLDTDNEMPAMNDEIIDYQPIENENIEEQINKNIEFESSSDNSSSDNGSNDSSSYDSGSSSSSDSSSSSSSFD